MTRASSTAKRCRVSSKLSREPLLARSGAAARSEGAEADPLSSPGASREEGAGAAAEEDLQALLAQAGGADGARHVAAAAQYDDH